MVIMVTEDMHLCVNTKYWAVFRGRGYGYVYNNQDYRCRGMDYVTTLLGSTAQAAQAEMKMQATK